jgi:excisionase family DNA binding protein
VPSFQQGQASRPRIVTVKELSRYLHVHPTTVYRLLKREELPAFRVGNRWRFDLRKIDEWRLARSSGSDGERSL